MSLAVIIDPDNSWRKDIGRWVRGAQSSQLLCLVLDARLNLIGKLWPEVHSKFHLPASHSY